MKKGQQRIFDILQGKKVSFTVVDIAQDMEKKEYLKRKTGACTVPYVFQGGEPCLNYEEFMEAIEEGLLMEKLKYLCC